MSSIQNVVSLILLCLVSQVAFANEANSRFGGRSWQFDTPNDRVAKQNNLVLYCQQHPNNCDSQSSTANHSIVSPGNQTGAGPGVGGSNSIVGNNVTIVIEGNNNVVEISGDQSMVDSPQSIEHTVSDNNVNVTETVDGTPN